MQFVIKKPIITEQSMKDAKSGKFTFLVDKAATKLDVRAAIEKLFGVNVTGVTTVTIRSTKVVMTKFGRKSTKNHIKKARVTLKKGQTIAAFDAPEDEKKKKKDKKEEVHDK